MTIVIRRPTTAIAMLAAAGILLAGCDSGPSQAGSAVIIGGSVITVDQVQREVSDLLATQDTARQSQQQGKLDQVSRGVLTTHVLHTLVTRAAGREHLNVPDQQVDQLISQAGGADKVAAQLQVGSAQAHDVVRDVLLEVALARKYADSLTVKFDYVTTDNRADALARANQLAADPGALAGMVKSITAAGHGAQTGTTLTLASFFQNELQQEQQAAQQGQQAPNNNQIGPLFAAPANTVLAFQPAPGADPTWVVAVIRARTTGGSGSSAGSSAAASASLSTLRSIGVALLAQDAADLGVRVSPRYGAWDPVGMRVAAADDQTSGVEVALHGPRS